MKIIKPMACDEQAISTANSLPCDTEAVKSPLFCDKQAISTASNLPNETQAVKPPLLQLPLELRRMIYSESILASRCPTPEEVHERIFGAIWEDVPSPLLAVNKQIRDELFDDLHKAAFTMRVTSYGASFDMLGLTCFIAQQRPKTYSGLPKLIIEIWPPHPDRPIEMYNINCHIRDLRNELRATSVGIASLTIWFRENEIAKWTRDDGQARFDLDEDGDESHPLCSDIAKILYHFACVTNVTKAQIHLPPSLERCDKNDEVRRHAMNVTDAMEGKGTLADRMDYTLADHDISDMEERYLVFATAEKARAKLDAITFDGHDTMTEAEWLAFAEVWPPFETLPIGWDEEDEFKGEWHYRCS